MRNVWLASVPVLLLCACGKPTPEAAPAQGAAGDAAVAAPAAREGATPAPAALPGQVSSEASEDTERAMDEVPSQTVLPNGDTEYGFANGCKVVLQGKRAVLRNEGPECELHHRDIALLYASGD